MAGRQTTFAHPTADKILGGMKAHLKEMERKHGIDFVTDWREVHAAETRWAMARCRRRDFAVLDTETTDVSARAEMVEVAVIGPHGKDEYNGMLRPRSRIIAPATNVHGITNSDVSKSPQLPEQHDAIQKALVSQRRLIIYNQSFDLRILEQSAYAHNLPAFKVPAKIDDLMIRFSRWAGIWNPKRSGYKWARLDSGHRAAGDCKACIGLIEKMARVPVTVEW
jgi:DNA polymerase III epsilon subunit-like protein